MNIIISEDGIYNPDTCSIQPHEALAFGHAYASLFGRSVAVGYSSEVCPSAVYALFSGILSAGANVWNAGRCTMPQLSSVIRKAGCDGGIFVNMSASAKLIPVHKSGYSLTEAQEQRLIGVINEKSEIDNSCKAQLHDASAFVRLYEEELAHKAESLEYDGPLMEEIDRQGAKNGVTMPCLVQVNIAGEKQKGGVAPEETLDFLRRAAAYEHAAVRGLMAIMPLGAPREDLFRFFTGMRSLFEKCAGENIPGVQMAELSMGMSQDFDLAARAGATMVRVGSRLFNP